MFDNCRANDNYALHIMRAGSSPMIESFYGITIENELSVGFGWRSLPKFRSTEVLAIRFPQ